jgi:DNA invertase Pin-like site-specific DNA recombinase
MATILYARVSDAAQTLEHQKTQAEAAGFVLDEVIADQGVSGVSVKLKDRPQGRRLFDILRRGDTLVVRWVDRLGRNYEDVTSTLREFIERGVIVETVINRMKFDGSTQNTTEKAVRDALIGFLAAMAQAQVEANREAQLAGIENAKTEKPNAYRGRKPSYTREQFQTVQDMLATGAGVSAIAKETQLQRGTIYRIKNEPEAAEKALQVWGIGVSDASKPDIAAQAALQTG